MRDIHLNHRDSDIPIDLFSTIIHIADEDSNGFRFTKSNLINCKILMGASISYLDFYDVSMSVLQIDIGYLRNISLRNVVADKIILTTNQPYKLKSVELISSNIGELSIILGQPSDNISGHALRVDVLRDSDCPSGTVLGTLSIKNDFRKHKEICLEHNATNRTDWEEIHPGNLIDNLVLDNVGFNMSCNNFTQVLNVELLNGCTLATHKIVLPDLKIDLSKGTKFPEGIRTATLAFLKSFRAPRTPEGELAPDALFSHNPMTSFKGLENTITVLLFSGGLMKDASVINSEYSFIKAVHPEGYEEIFFIEDCRAPGSSTLLLNSLEDATDLDREFISSMLPYILQNRGNRHTLVGYLKDLSNFGIMLTRDGAGLRGYSNPSKAVPGSSILYPSAVSSRKSISSVSEVMERHTNFIDNIWG